MKRGRWADARGVNRYEQAVRLGEQLRRLTVQQQQFFRRATDILPQVLAGKGAPSAPLWL